MYVLCYCGLLFPVLKDVLLMMSFLLEYKVCMHKLFYQLPNYTGEQRRACTATTYWRRDRNSCKWQLMGRYRLSIPAKRTGLVTLIEWSIILLQMTLLMKARNNRFYCPLVERQHSNWSKTLWRRQVGHNVVRWYRQEGEGPLWPGAVRDHAEIQVQHVHQGWGRISHNLRPTSLR